MVMMVYLVFDEVLVVVVLVLLVGLVVSLKNKKLRRYPTGFFGLGFCWKHTEQLIEGPLIISDLIYDIQPKKPRI